MSDLDCRCPACLWSAWLAAWTAVGALASLDLRIGLLAAREAPEPPASSTEGARP